MKTAVTILLATVTLAACSSTPRPATDADHRACKDQAYDDPVVKAMIMKSAGTDRYVIDNQYAMKYAEEDAVLTCLRARGLVPPGGVERQKSFW